ncbi:MAG: hypothetical protein WC055_02255 [Melioribacteraceae bacterium]
MKKAPSYKGGGNLIKGEPNKPKKTTIDRTKYKAILDRPIEGTGTNVVGDSQDNFTPEVLKNMGYNYYSGTMGGKDIVYEKGGRYHIYNEQPNAKQNKFGLIDIGDLSEPPINPTPALTTPTVPKMVKPQIDPTHKSLDFSNPNMILDPNTGTYTNPVTGKRIEPIVEQYKHGGKVKGLAFGGSTSYNERFNTVNQLNTQQNQQAEADSPSFLSKNQNTSRVLGSGVMTLGNQMYQRKYGASANPEEEAKYDQAVGAVDSTASSALPWYALAKGASNIGKSQIKRDENGRATTKVGSVSDDWLTPDHELIMQGYKQDGVKGALRESSGLGKIGRTIGTLTNNANETEGFWGKFNKATGQAGKNKSAGMDEAAKQAQLDAIAAEKAKQKDAINKGRIAESLAARNAGDTNFEQDYFNQTLADGGIIKGAGTAKSDSISAKVKPGSFVVPAENAPIAAELKDKLLRKAPSKKASLNQGGGVDVKLSDGEYLFSPEEKMELQANGVDLNALAPNAKEEDKLKCGGKVPMYKSGGGINKVVSDLDIIEIASGGKGYESLSDKDKKRVDDLKKLQVSDIKKVPSYKNGGGVNGNNDDFEKKELAKIEAQRKADAARLGEIKAKQKADEAKRALASDIRQRLEIQYNAKKQSKANIDKYQNEYNAIKKAYDNYSKESDFELNRPLSTGERYTKSAKPTTEEVRKNKEDLLKKLQDSKSKLDAAQKDYNYASNERNFITPETGRGLKSSAGKGLDNLKSDKATTREAVNAPLTATSTQNIAKELAGRYKTAPKKSGNKPATEKAVADTLSPIDINQIPTSESDNLFDSRTSAEMARMNQPVERVSLSAPDAINPTVTEADQAPMQTNSSGQPKFSKFNLSGALDGAINYGLPIAQTAIGFSQLKKLGKRPVDTLDPEYLNAISKTRAGVEKANQQAKFGYSPQELAALNQQNAALTNAGRYAARNFSGGSAANALNMERSVINDSFGRGLTTSINDNALKMQKQQLAFERQSGLNDMLSHKQELNRRLFSDTMSAWQQNQGSAASLANAGIQNLLDANRYDKFMKSSQEVNNQI